MMTKNQINEREQPGSDISITYSKGEVYTSYAYFVIGLVDKIEIS
ncbi:hypothetical protein [Sporosarcina sp. A2]